MFKITIKYLIALLLSMMLIVSNTSAHHKSKKEKNVKTEWNGDSKTKKVFEKQSLAQYCALKAQAITIPGEPILDQNNKNDDGNPVQTKDENGIPQFEDDTYKIKITGYHSVKSKKAGDVLIPTPANGLNFNYKNKWTTDIKLIDVLKMYCLQDSSKDRPTKFKDSYLDQFYTNIAFDNNYLSKDGTKGDYNKKLMEGPEGRGPIEGRDILIDGIIINNQNAVWYVPDFLFKEEARLKKEAKQKEKEEKKRKEEEERKRLAKVKADALKEGNSQWISKNKQDYINDFDKKLEEYKAVISKLEAKRGELIIKVADFEILQLEATEKVENAIDDLVNTANQEIKELRSEIREEKKLLLKTSDLKGYKEELKKIEKIKFNDYARYKTLKNLIKRAKKSKKATDFVGKSGFEVKLPKILGGKKKKLTGDKIGFIQEFRNIESKELNTSSDEGKIKKLSTELENHTNNIDQFIQQVSTLTALDEAIQKETPWGKYAIYFVIFLVIVGVIVYVVIQQNNLKRIRRESEEKVGSLKSDFENKLKDTSEQIKSVSRTAAAARSQQSETSSIPEPVEEIPKTQEEIIAAKYDELLSDYKDALDDFSKVAVFKQKWNGLALSRKERQDGSKTILISASRAFEKSGIWCVSFDDKYFAFPGSTVKSNMATYMNMDFMKAGQDFKGVFGVTTSSAYSSEPSVLRKSGAGYVVERVGKIAFPD